MELLKRKIDQDLITWKKDPGRLPLIVKGARQVGKTESIRHFGRTQYTHFIEINFILQKQFRDIFDDGYEVDTIISNITFKNPSLEFIPGETLILFDEIQACPDCATSLKSFKMDGRYDVICSGSLMGINYNEIESNSVGFKSDYTMYSMDFEEFLWAKGYSGSQIDTLYSYMDSVRPYPKAVMSTMMEIFHEYMTVGGMPAIVARYIRQHNYSGILGMQQQILLDYEEDITKYAGRLDKTKILNVFRRIPVFLGKDNKKFMISKVAHNARNRDYAGVTDWLENAGIVNICYCLHLPELPLKGNYEPDNYKLYYGDTGLLVGSLDEESQKDLRDNKNFNAYKGALYENAVGEMLVKQGYHLYFYRNEKGTLEMDFFVRNTDSLIPVEVKAQDGATASLNNLIKKDKFIDIRYGIKLGNLNSGYNGIFYTFPYFMAFKLKDFVNDHVLKAGD